MKVFLSWSGTTSHKVALAFRDWLPSVIQSIQPYVSSEDINKGARWSTDIAKELEDSTFGILCVTKDNIDAPWLNFEAGALSKTIEKTFVSPFLFNVKRSEVDGPVLQFQSTIYEKEDIKKLLLTINNACAEFALDEVRLLDTFDVWYPKLEENLNGIRLTKDESINTSDANEQESTSSEILEELLELSRSNQKLLRNPDSDNYSKIEDILLDIKRTQKRLNGVNNKKLMNSQIDLLMMSKNRVEKDGNIIANLLVLTGLYKDVFPWLYDTTYEAIKCIDNKDFELFSKLKDRLRKYINPEFTERFLREKYYYAEQKEMIYVYRELAEFVHYNLLNIDI